MQQPCNFVLTILSSYHFCFIVSFVLLHVPAWIVLDSIYNCLYSVPQLIITLGKYLDHHLSLWALPNSWYAHRSSGHGAPLSNFHQSDWSIYVVTMDTITLIVRSLHHHCCACVWSIVLPSLLGKSSLLSASKCKAHSFTCSIFVAVSLAQPVVPVLYSLT